MTKLQKKRTAHAEKKQNIEVRTMWQNLYDQPKNYQSHFNQNNQKILTTQIRP